jgi:choline dehydrogenase-like flavoprotein
MIKQHIDSLQHSVDLEHASSRVYDVVIVGAGVSGAIMAKELANAGFHVLILEAGPGRDFSQDGSQKYLETFYSEPYKDNNSPFRHNRSADMPRSPNLHPLPPDGKPDSKKYIVQYGPFITDTVYTRVFGGTTVHWEGKTIRMLREDFSLRSTYGQGLDWPIGLDDLLPYYRRAENELGVAGDAESQRSLGVEFDEGYVYPMVELKASYLDNIVGAGLKNSKVRLHGEDFPLDLATFPQAKNSDPNPAYAKWNGGVPFTPRGAISLHEHHVGERCQGNSNCVPLCPVQARYDARKTVLQAMFTGKTDLIVRAVASRVHFDPASGAVCGIEAKIYDDRDSTKHQSRTFKGRAYVLAANAVENARLMLASAVLNNRPVNTLMGRHLMDHPYLLSWALLPQNAGVGRGPSCTSGFCRFRRGKFRSQMAAFAADIHNDGWGWATGAPNNDLIESVNQGNYGNALRQDLIRRISRQLLLAYMIELPADPANRVTVDPQFLDALENMKPVFHWTIPEYSFRTVEFARNLSNTIFKTLGADDKTKYDPKDYGYQIFSGQGYAIRGGNHLSGTHVMGTAPGNSVVDENQRSWESPNLYLVGPGSLCSIGSSNTTLTTAALAFKSAQALVKTLKVAHLASTTECHA